MILPHILNRLINEKHTLALTHAQTHNHVHIVTSALLNLATVLSRCNKCLRTEAWEVFPQIRDAAAVSDYLSAVMELCSLRQIGRAHV